MSTKPKLSVKKASGDWIALSLNLAFRKDDPQLGKIYRKFSLFVRQCFTEEQAEQIINQIEAQFKQLPASNKVRQTKGQT